MKKYFKILIVIIFVFIISINKNMVDAKSGTICRKSNRTKTCHVYKNGYKSYWRRIKTTTYKNGKKKYRDYIYKNKKGVRIITKQFQYNKKGQLKSNKNGKASRRYYYYYSNNKISKRVTWKYNKKGKLYNRKIVTKKYTKNKPKTFGDKIVNAGKTFNNQNMVCTEFVSKSLFKAGFVENKDSWSWAWGVVNGHKYKKAHYYPSGYSNSSTIVIKDSMVHKEYLEYIKNKDYTMKLSQLKTVKDRKSLIKTLKAGDIIIYNGGAHEAVYMSDNKAIQGGLADKNGKYQKVGIAPLDLGKKFKITEIIRVYK